MIHTTCLYCLNNFSYEPKAIQRSRRRFCNSCRIIRKNMTDMKITIPILEAKKNKEYDMKIVFSYDNVSVLL